MYYFNSKNINMQVQLCSIDQYFKWNFLKEDFDFFTIYKFVMHNIQELWCVIISNTFYNNAMSYM